jgi:murein DD-endopeptidase MepM/ murein hydrolase activator NlpD
MGSPRDNTERAGLIVLFALLALLPLALLGLGPDAGVAHGQEPGARVTGQGLASFPPTNGNGAVPGCRFAVDASRDDSGSQGSFTCDIQNQTMGLPFTSVDVAVNNLDTPSQDEAVLDGPALVGLPDGGSLHDVPATVYLHGGGRGTGAIRIDLQGVFDGQPGDQTPGDGNYSLIPQSVTEGSIDIEIVAPSPSPSPSVSPTGSPQPSPSPTGSPEPSPSPHPSPSSSGAPPPVPPGPPGPGAPLPGPPFSDAPFTLGGTHSTARLMAMLSQLSPNGTPRFDDILAVVGPFPVAGLAWWQNDWHAYRCCPYPHLHQGLDMFAPRGTPVVAAADGYVSQKFNGPISGLAVEITDSANTQYFYAHLSAFGPGIEPRTTVRVGQVVGYIGNTGNASSTSPHLHFEVQPNGVPVPPMPFVDSWLVQSEQRAVALVAQRTGKTFPYPDESTIRLWITRALALAEQRNAGELGDESALGVHRPVAELFGLRPPGPFAGFAAGALFVLILLPVALAGLRDARRGLARVAAGPIEESASDTEVPADEAAPPGERPDPGGLGRHRPAAR